MIDKLEAFIVLARERHFGRAAESLGVTQPTLSAAIKGLEQELGVTLVNRGSRFQGLTAEGEQVLGWARRIAGDARAMRDEMRAARSGLSGLIRIAAIPTALAMVPRLTTPLRDRHPGISFSVLSQTSIEVLSLLTPDMQNRRIIDLHFAEAGVHVRPTLESNSMIVLFSHIRTGKWSSIMPLNLAETFGFAEPIRAIPIVEPYARHSVGLVVARRDLQTPLVGALIDQARALAASFRSEERP